MFFVFIVIRFYNHLIIGVIRRLKSWHSHLGSHCNKYRKQMLAELRGEVEAKGDAWLVPNLTRLVEAKPVPNLTRLPPIRQKRAATQEADQTKSSKKQVHTLLFCR